MTCRIWSRWRRSGAHEGLPSLEMVKMQVIDTASAKEVETGEDQGEARRQRGG